MADNLQKYPFTSEQVQKIQVGITHVHSMFQKILGKHQASKRGNYNEVVNVLVAMKDYVFANIGKNPPRAILSFTHSKAQLQRLRKAKESLKVVFESVQPARKPDEKKKFAYVMDLFNRMVPHVEYRIRLEK